MPVDRWRGERIEADPPEQIHAPVGPRRIPVTPLDRRLDEIERKVDTMLRLMATLERRSGQHSARLDNLERREPPFEPILP